MTREKDPRGKILIIGGGIANFTDVAATFTGLIKAIVNFQDDLKAHHVRIDIFMLLYLLISYDDISFILQFEHNFIFIITSLHTVMNSEY